MPISDDDVRKPYWIKFTEGATLTRDNNDRFMKAELYTREYRNGFLQEGYNPNHNSPTVEKINIESDNITIKGN